MADGDSRHEGRGELPQGGEPRPQGTWLVVRYDLADVGARPIPNGERFWETTPIRVIGGDANGNPTAGTTVGVEALVTNYGRLDAAPVRVDFAFIAGTLGILPENPELIGTAWTTVPAEQTVPVRCPADWTPPNVPGDLHCCLLVTVSAPAQGDTPIAPADPVLDRHVGQHNLTVLSATGEPRKLSMEVGLANLGARRAVFQVAVAATRFRARGDELDRNPIQPNGIAAATRAAERARSLEQARLWSRRAALLGALAEAVPYEVVSEGELSEMVRLLRLREGEHEGGATVQVPPRGPLEPSGFLPLEGEIELDPGQTGTAALELYLPAGEEDTGFALHVAQVSEDRLSGGYGVLSLP